MVVNTHIVFLYQVPRYMIQPLLCWVQLGDGSTAVGLVLLRPTQTSRIRGLHRQRQKQLTAYSDCLSHVFRYPEKRTEGLSSGNTSMDVFFGWLYPLQMSRHSAPFCVGGYRRPAVAAFCDIWRQGLPLTSRSGSCHGGARIAVGVVATSSAECRNVRGKHHAWKHPLQLPAGSSAVSPVAQPMTSPVVCAAVSPPTPRGRTYRGKCTRMYRLGALVRAGTRPATRAVARFTVCLAYGSR